MWMVKAGWGAVWLEGRDIPEAAISTAWNYGSGTSGERNEEPSEKCFSIKINWPLLTNCMEAVMR